MPRLLAIVLFFSPDIVVLGNCATAYGDDAPFRITTKRDDDKVEVTLRKALLEDNPKSITLNWINLYR